MIKVIIDKSCQAWGQCVFDAPEVFDLVNSERKTWQYVVNDNLEEKVMIASRHCPNEAISFIKVDDE
jgi:ferredoxin